jgi:hypothetical protein
MNVRIVLHPVMWVHPALRNFLIRESISFDQPKKADGTLRLNCKACLVKVTEPQNQLVLWINEERFIPVPVYATYYESTLTTRAGLAAKVRERGNRVINRVAQIENENSKKKITAGIIERAYKLWLETCSHQS